MSLKFQTLSDKELLKQSVPDLEVALEEAYRAMKASGNDHRLMAFAMRIDHSLKKARLRDANAASTATADLAATDRANLHKALQSLGTAIQPGDERGLMFLRTAKELASKLLPVA